MKTKCVIIDFDDSFTFNIASEVFPLFDEVEVIHHLQWGPFLAGMHWGDRKHVIILGPGPGHPDEYQHMKSGIIHLMGREDCHLMGICLGHQLIWSALGKKIVPSRNKCHGESVEIHLSQQWQRKLKTSHNQFLVQRYNSLVVSLDNELIDDWTLLFDDQGELMGSFNQRVLTYQFHPESVGTTCPKTFFCSLF